ncbi:TPA: prenyltransferase, partial [Candidatus Bathyarchaeota archaeon]|nr:prenyltransferase [Candidatus Bathyarchaeota archaeon]
MKKLVGALKLIRPVNCSMMGLAVIISELIALNGTLTLKPAALGFSVAFLSTAGTMALNDYYDLEIDLINEPSRPIPSGLIAPKEALTCALVCASSGILASAMINVQALAIAILATMLMVYYNAKGKKTGLSGSFVVSACVALPFIFGGYAAGNMKEILWVFALMAFFANTGREVVKGVVDVKGDSLKRVKTPAVLFGPRKASLMATSFFIAAVALSLLPILFGLVSIVFVPIVAVSDAGFVFLSFKLMKDPSTKNARKVKNKIL